MFVFLFKVLSVLTFASSSAYLDRIDPKWCELPNKRTYHDVILVPQKALPKNLINQGEFGSCYAMTAKNLVECLKNESQSNSKAIDTSRIFISVVGLLGSKDKNLESSGGGNIYTVLQKIRSNHFVVFQDDSFTTGKSDYEKIIKSSQFDTTNACIRSGKYDSVKTWIYDSDVSPDLNRYLKSEENKKQYESYFDSCTKDSATCLFNLLYNSKFKSTFTLPTFNTYVIDDPGLPNSLKQADASVILKMNKVLSIGYPLGLATGLHALTVIGSRKVCCESTQNQKGKKKKASECQNELKILDSLDDDQNKDNWFSQDAALSAYSYMTYTVPCDSDDTASHEKIQEKCVPYTQGKWPFYYALQADDLDFVKKQIDSKKVDVNSSFDGKKLIEIALGQGSVRVVNFLLDSGVPTSTARWSGIHEASRSDSPALVQAFLNHQVKIDAKDEIGRSPLEIALLLRNSNLIRFLIEQGADLKAAGSKSSILASTVYGSQAKAGDVEYFLKKGFDPNELDGGSSALHKAVFYAGLEKRTDIVELLCNYKADALLKNSQGETALDLANKAAYQPLIDVLEKCNSL